MEAVKGAEYELRLVNSLPVRVAVAVSVDGLSIIDARHTTAWDASKWVIHPHGTLNITGWQVGSEETEYQAALFHHRARRVRDQDRPPGRFRRHLGRLLP